VPTPDAGQRLTRSAVGRIVADLAFATTSTDQAIGLEIEVFALRPASTVDGAAGLVRPPIRGNDGLAAMVFAAVESELAVTSPLPDRWPVASGAVTFEPGGQIEYSSGVHATSASVLDEVEQVMGRLAMAAGERGIALASTGHDAWTDPDDVGQQLDAARYRVMDAYLGQRGGGGQRMMRHTAALQVNLDPGRGDVGERRWRLANLVAPLSVASFACSPAAPPDPAVSVRARTWRNLDPTRTGIPGGRGMHREVDRAADLTRFALDADVLMLRLPDGSVEAGPGRFTFGNWIDAGHPRAGWPTAADLREHLTTLFTEVRPRGALEIRSIDALPSRFRAVPVVLLAGLLLHQPTTELVLELMAPTADRIDDRLARAGEVGLKDPELCANAVEIWSFALAGAAALPAGWVRPHDLRAVEQFIDQFTMRGRCPADDLRQLLASDPLAALRWASEPIPSRQPA